MSSTNSSDGFRNLGVAIVALGTVVAALVLGRSFLIPLAIAILLWNLLEAVIEAFQRLPIAGHRLSRPLATIFGVTCVAFGFYVVFSILLSQVDGISAVWPRYVGRLEALVNDLAQWMGPELSAKVRKLVSDFDLTRRFPALLSSAQSFVMSFLLVLAYVGFLLAEGGHLGAKVAAMSSNEDKAKKTSAVLTTISKSIRQYIWIKTIVSLITGISSYALLRWIGVDFAETWAILIFVLNFIPNIGSIIAVAFPALIALVQFDTLTPFFTLTIGLTVLQVAVGSVLEPFLMGSSLNMSPFAIILGLAFWGTIWGIVGMFLSVPIMVLLMIVCSYVPSWRWVAVLLSQDGRVPSQ